MQDPFRDSPKKSDSTGCQTVSYSSCFPVALPSVSEVTHATEWQMMEIYIEPSQFEAAWAAEKLVQLTTLWMIVTLKCLNALGLIYQISPFSSCPFV